MKIDVPTLVISLIGLGIACLGAVALLGYELPPSADHWPAGVLLGAGMIGLITALRYRQTEDR